MNEWMNDPNDRVIKLMQTASGFKSQKNNLVSESGFEPMTIVLLVCSTTNWATAMAILVVSVNKHKMLTQVMCQATVQRHIHHFTVYTTD